MECLKIHRNPRCFSPRLNWHLSKLLIRNAIFTCIFSHQGVHSIAPRSHVRIISLGTAVPPMETSLRLSYSCYACMNQLAPWGPTCALGSRGLLDPNVVHPDNRSLLVDSGCSNIQASPRFIHVHVAFHRLPPFLTSSYLSLMALSSAVRLSTSRFSAALCLLACTSFLKRFTVFHNGRNAQVLHSNKRPNQSPPAEID